MEEKGFYHNSRGYWQVIGEVTKETLASFPSGTVEVPLKPNGNCEWTGSEWVDLPPVVPTKEQQESLRQISYAQEADPLFFQWQAGEATQEEWLAKREEIRLRYPYPTEE